jgi:hypothetical protein
MHKNGRLRAHTSFIQLSVAARLVVKLVPAAQPRNAKLHPQPPPNPQPQPQPQPQVPPTPPPPNPNTPHPVSQVHAVHPVLPVEEQRLVSGGRMPAVTAAWVACFKKMSVVLIGDDRVSLVNTRWEAHG